MGSLEMRNLLLSKKLKLSETRLLIIDDNQIRYNEILNIFQSKNHPVHAILLDDLSSFEKQLHTRWDLVIFGQAYDLKLEQAITLIHASSQIDIPVLLLKPQDYKPEHYQTLIHKGVYDIVNIAHPERVYISTIRALSYSRTLQAQKNLLCDLDTAKTQAQALVQEQKKAVATLEEGMHSQANEEYLKLFGIDSEDDILGLPILDVLKPKNLNDFKTRFKKFTQGQTELSRFEITTQNEQALSENPLKIEFLPGEDGTVQIAIETANTAPIAQPSVASAPTNNADDTFHLIQRHLIQQPATANALIIFSFSKCDDEILHLNWADTKAYLSQLKEFIKEQTGQRVFKINTVLHAIIMQAESATALESKVSALNSLEKQQLLNINNRTFPLQLKLGFSPIQLETFSEANFEGLLAKAYDTSLPKRESASDLQLEATLQETTIELISNEELSVPNVQPLNTPIIQPTLNIEPVQRESPILKEIQQKLEKGEIHLKYQQLYDKQDTNLYTYEVTSGFIYENNWKKTCSLVELDDDVELSIKLDRWIMVEACKQLHNFITQYPDAKLIINLNRHILFQDKQFPELVAKLITIVGSKLSHPLILQFDEEDIAKSPIEAQKQFNILREHGAEIAIRNFGSTISTEAIVKQTDLALLSLDEKYTDMLADEKSLAELQNMIQHYTMMKPLVFLLKNLNDMNAFANAWNVDVRFIQGDYFQKRMDHLTDVQDQ